MKKLAVRIDGKLYKVKKKHLKKYLAYLQLSSNFHMMVQKLLQETIKVNRHNMNEHLGKIKDLTNSAENFMEESYILLNTRFVVVEDNE